MTKTAEHIRLEQEKNKELFWKRWGPYVSERSWGTVREDYSASGDAWGFLTHDMARSKAYRWGEDGLAGYCDRYQLLCFSLALWNGKDPILKERAFGLVPSEGNHGEDVKELYYYLDSTPTHSYMRYLYKYPHAAYPYEQLIQENQRREGRGPEYELLDTGIFDDDRYFDVFVEYAKDAPDTTCIKITVHNRGPERESIHIIPQISFRNAWAWGQSRGAEPLIDLVSTSNSEITLRADDTDSALLKNLPHAYKLGEMYLSAPAGGTPLFTNNETNAERLYGTPNATPYVKDAFHRHIINGESCVNPHKVGTKAGIHYILSVEPGRSESIMIVLGREDAPKVRQRGERILAERQHEADEFYATVHPPKATEVYCGQNSFTTSMLRIGFAETIPTPRLRTHDSRDETVTGNTSTRCASSRCLTSGSIRGLPLGISLFTPSPSHSLISSSRRNSSGSCSLSSFNTRTVRYQRMNGSSRT